MSNITSRVLPSNQLSLQDSYKQALHFLHIFTGHTNVFFKKEGADHFKQMFPLQDTKSFLQQEDTDRSSSQ